MIPLVVSMDKLMEKANYILKQTRSYPQCEIFVDLFRGLPIIERRAILGDRARAFDYITRYFIDEEHGGFTGS